MGDETGNLDKETVADEAIELMAGERLAEARRDSQIGVIDIAKELHLDEHKVRALERNEFDRARCTRIRQGVPQKVRTVSQG